MSNSNRRFWSSIPGLVTGLAGVVTAIVGLVTVLINLDVIGGDSGNGTDDPTVSTSTAPPSGATTVPRAGTAGAAPTFEVTPTAVNLTLLNTDDDVTVRNRGSAPLRVTTELTGGAPQQFEVDDQDCTSATVASQCVIKVTYRATAAGDHVARLQVEVEGAPTREVQLTGKAL